jgi:hypothetical protein
MKIIKSLGTIIGLFILAQVLMAVLVPQGGSALAPLLNIVLVCSLLLGVFSLLLGGKNSALKSVSKTLGLIIGLVILTIVIAIMTGSINNITETFISRIVPFGQIIGIIFGFVKADAVFGAADSLAVDFAKDSAKLIFGAVLYPIITGLVFEFIFKSEREKWENDNDYSRRGYFMFMNPDPAYDKRHNNFFERFSLRGIAAWFFGGIYTAYAATFLFNGLIIFLSGSIGIGETAISIILFIIIIGLILLAWLSPILRADLRPHTGLMLPKGRGVLYKLLFSLLKMMAINIILVLVVGLLTGTAY